MIVEFARAGLASSFVGFFGVSVFILVCLTVMRRRGERKSFFISFFFRLLTLLFLGLAFAGPYREETAASGNLTALLDVSDSVDTKDGEAMFNMLKAFEKSTLPISLYPFATTMSGIPFSLDDFSSYADLQKAFSTLDSQGTALSESVKSLIEKQGGGQLLLATDGYETRGSLREQLPLLRQRGVRVYPLIPREGAEDRGVFRIAQVYAPLTTPQLSTVQVRVTIENTTGHERLGELEIFQGNQSLVRHNVKVGAKSEQVYLAQTLPANGGIDQIRAVLTPREKAIPLSEQRAYISAEGRERVLLLSGSSADASYVGRVLENQAYQLDNRIGSASLSTDLLDSYSTIILNNYSLEQLGRGNADAVVRAVKQGKGMIMVGGERSFGLGGYRGTVIEDALPVELLPPQREERRLNVAVMLVIDKSRSMDSERKMDYAKEAARTFISNMKDDDYIGVIAFDASPFIVVRLGQLSEIRSMASDRISRIFPTGSTRPLSAIDEARRGLMRVNAGRKHMLFLTDGQIEDAGPHYKELVKQMRLVGITSSTVMLGDESDGGFLRSLAEQGGGAYYQTNDARSLPRIFLNDVRVAGGERTMHEERSYSVEFADGQAVSTSIDDFPQVYGYVQTKIKPKADLELVVSGGEKRDPLLARWQFGQGKVVAFTSDANGRWSKDWISWSKYHQFWNDLLNSVRTQSESTGEKIPFDMRYFMEDGKLVVEYALYAENLSEDLSAIVKMPNGEVKNISFRAISRGRYRSEIENPIGGRYDISGAIDRKVTAPVAFSLPEDQFKEQKGLGFNRTLLDLIAKSTESMINPSTDILLSDNNRETKRVDQSAFFFALALLLALMEILMREVVYRPRWA